jgi:acetyltransferase-like isoleucine patch superfamily enzyme
VEGEFSMGDSYINSHARILCGNKINIGDDVSIAWNVQILDDDRHDLTVAGNPTQRTGQIHIDDDVWIGHDVSIHKGVTVHSGSVVASNSVVTTDVPPQTLVAGTPAEVIRRNVDWG